jgi:hypothetical protein
MLVDNQDLEVLPDELEADNAVVASDLVLGNGARNDINDVVFIRPEVFDPSKTPAIALELEAVNRGLVEAGRPYLLIGFGRWGTSDPWLGVPVAWGQISGAQVIVEATLPDVNPDLSQGSHFFHNLLANRVLYLSVLHDGPYRIDWTWLENQPIMDQRSYITHVRSAEPLDIRVHGGSGLGVVHHHE